MSLDLFNNKANEEEYFTGLKCLHIYPSEDLGNTFDGTMNFTREYLDHIEDLGFSDGVKALSSLDVRSTSLEGGLLLPHAHKANIKGINNTFFII